MAEVTSNPLAGEVTDSLGRLIKFRKLKASDRGKLSRALGAAAKDEMTFGQSYIAYMVTSIDGDAVFAPSNLMEAEILTDRLGDEGLEAVGRAYAKAWPSALTDGDIDAAKN